MNQERSQYGRTVYATVRLCLCTGGWRVGSENGASRCSWCDPSGSALLSSAFCASAWLARGQRGWPQLMCARRGGRTRIGRSCTLSARLSVSCRNRGGGGWVWRLRASQHGQSRCDWCSWVLGTRRIECSQRVCRAGILHMGCASKMVHAGELRWLKCAGTLMASDCVPHRKALLEQVMASDCVPHWKALLEQVR